MAEYYLLNLNLNLLHIMGQVLTVGFFLIIYRIWFYYLSIIETGESIISVKFCNGLGNLIGNSERQPRYLIASHLCYTCKSSQATVFSETGKFQLFSNIFLLFLHSIHAVSLRVKFVHVF